MSKLAVPFFAPERKSHDVQIQALCPPGPAEGSAVAGRCGGRTVRMTFKHKLSVRLALLKDVLPLVSVVGLLAACEVPSPVGPTPTTYAHLYAIVTTPESVTLEPGPTLRFGADGRTPTRA